MAQFKVLLELKVQQVLKVQLAIKVKKVKPEILVQLELKEILAQPVLQDHKVLKV